MAYGVTGDVKLRRAAPGMISKKPQPEGTSSDGSATVISRSGHTQSGSSEAFPKYFGRGASLDEDRCRHIVGGDVNELKSLVNSRKYNAVYTAMTKAGSDIYTLIAELVYKYEFLRMKERRDSDRFSFGDIVRVKDAQTGMTYDFLHCMTGTLYEMV